MNGSPVLQALVNARIEQEPTAFGKWCVVRGTRSLPALPIHVANFVAECQAASTPIETIWEMVREVSEAHIANGLADPTAGGVVGETINSISKIAPPRSWPKGLWPRFYALPFDLQQYLVSRDSEVNREVHKAHNEADKARKALEAIQKKEIENDQDTPAR